MYKKLTMGGALFLMLAAQAEAAVLQMTEGLAWVASGNGVYQATNNIQLKPGDRINVVEGCATIVYEPGAESQLCKGEMAVVRYLPPAPSPSPPPAEGLLSFNIYTYVLPGLAIAGGAGAAVAALGRGRPPVSP
jgi:hypothetical protein